jgi:hypothetical protein
VSRHLGLRTAAPALAVAALFAGCHSAVLDVEQRAVVDPLDELVWAPGTAADVPGSYTSVRIEGPAAAVLVEVHYRFDANGTFTGAGLVSQPTYAFQVLDGEWRVEDGLLYLSADGAPATLEVAEEYLRMAGDEGIVLLQRRPEA